MESRPDAAGRSRGPFEEEFEITHFKTLSDAEVSLNGAWMNCCGDSRRMEKKRQRKRVMEVGRLGKRRAEMIAEITKLKRTSARKRRDR